MDRAIKKTIHHRVGIHPGLLQPVMDLIEFFFGEKTNPAPAAQPQPRLRFAMGKRIPKTLKQTESIKLLKDQVITRKVNQIATMYGFTEQQEKDLLSLVRQDRTAENDRKIQQFIINKKIENIITKKKLQLTTTQTDTVTRLSPRTVLPLPIATLSPSGSPLSIVPAPLKFPDVPTVPPLPTAPARSSSAARQNRAGGDLRA